MLGNCADLIRHRDHSAHNCCDMPVYYRNIQSTVFLKNMLSGRVCVNACVPVCECVRTCVRMQTRVRVYACAGVCVRVDVFVCAFKCTRTHARV